MLLTLSSVLNQQELTVVRDLLTGGNFIDGKLSAGDEAIRVKNNQELSANDRLMAPLNNLVMGKLIKHPTYLAAALPMKIASPFYAKYGKGMSYGNHVDDPVMGPVNQRYRTDISITVFLNEPEDYEGGELTIVTPFGEQTAKLKAGDAIMYPSGSTHRVAQVTSGERIVAVTWLQSMVKDPAKRELLYKLSQARDILIDKSNGNEETELVSNTYINLVRLWSDT